MLLLKDTIDNLLLYRLGGFCYASSMT